MAAAGLAVLVSLEQHRESSVAAGKLCAVCMASLSNSPSCFSAVQVL